ncbi:MAG: GTP cyclohydrolase I FolE [Clostridiaceae bacterium]|jgi:GTP cyclohydrolase I|nr:GTP cyclohydrolase I FolE [Clostridiaceae bacterium]
MIDRLKAEKAVSDLLTALGEDVNNPSIVDTPARVARMFEELLSGRDQNPADHLSQVFPLEDPGLVIERNIPFYSLCEHHMLPFVGKVHIAYLPREEVTGLSKLARTVEVFARRLQLQERMTKQICRAIYDQLDPKGVLVVSEAEHFCMSMRGVKKPGATTITVASCGVFEDPAQQEHILSLLKL